MSAVIIGVIALFVWAFFSGTLSRAYTYVLESRESSAEFVTYYQWTDTKGQMKISREKPQGKDYIEFEGDKELQLVNYQIDPNLIENGKQAKESLLNNGNDDRTLLQRAVEIKKTGRILNNKARCSEIIRDITTYENKLKGNLLARDIDYYQQKLSEAKFQKLRNQC